MIVCGGFVQTAKFDLELVRSLVKDWLDGKEVGYFSAISCSVSYVVHVLSCSNTVAQNVILNGMLKLESSHFSKRVFLWGEVSDEYGLPEYEGHNWYVKFMLDEENFLESISFHPCEKDMKLANGILLKKSIDEEDKPHWRREVK